jgi:hypothetical protein
MVGTTGLLAPYRFAIGPIEGLFLPNNGEGELEASLLFPLFGIHSPIGPIPNQALLGNPLGTLPKAGTQH